MMAMIRTWLVVATALVIDPALTLLFVHMHSDSTANSNARLGNWSKNVMFHCRASGKHVFIQTPVFPWERSEGFSPAQHISGTKEERVPWKYFLGSFMQLPSWYQFCGKLVLMGMRIDLDSLILPISALSQHGSYIDPWANGLKTVLQVLSLSRMALWLMQSSGGIHSVKSGDLKLLTMDGISFIMWAVLLFQNACPIPGNPR